MSEKRFVAEQVDVTSEDETEVWDIVFDTENTYAFMVRDMDTANDLCGLLNELNTNLEKVSWRRAELETKNVILKKEIGEQQATIDKQQSLISTLKEENEKLRQRNRKLYKCALYGKTIGDENSDFIEYHQS